MTHLTNTGVTIGEITLEFSRVIVWEYRDVREATEEAKKLLGGRIASAIQIQLKDIACSLYEIIEAD